MMRRMYDSGRAVPRLAHTPAEVREAWGILRQLHGERRNSLGQSAACVAPLPKFPRRDRRSLPVAGPTAAALVTLDDQPVAAEYDLTGGDTVTCIRRLQPAVCRTSARLAQHDRHVAIRVRAGFQGLRLYAGRRAVQGSWRAKPRIQWHVRVAADRWLPGFAIDPGTRGVN